MFDPIPHYKRTGFRRDEDFQEISCHYDPALAGDARNAGRPDEEAREAAGQAPWRRPRRTRARRRSSSTSGRPSTSTRPSPSSPASPSRRISRPTRTRPRAWWPRGHPSRRETPSTRSPSSRNASLTRRSSRRRSGYSSVQGNLQFYNLSHAAPASVESLLSIM